MTPLEAALGTMIIFVALLWVIDKISWAKRESELLDRIMAKNFQEYVLAEDLRKSRKPVEMPPTNTDILPIT